MLVTMDDISVFTGKLIKTREEIQRLSEERESIIKHITLKFFDIYGKNLTYSSKNIGHEAPMTEFKIISNEKEIQSVIGILSKQISSEYRTFSFYDFKFDCAYSHTGIYAKFYSLENCNKFCKQFFISIENS